MWKSYGQSWAKFLRTRIERFNALDVHGFVRYMTNEEFIEKKGANHLY